MPIEEGFQEETFSAAPIIDIPIFVATIVASTFVAIVATIDTDIISKSASRSWTWPQL